MFLDGPQRKNGKRDQDSASSSTVLSTNQVFRQLNKRLSNGFACSPSRIIANVRTTRTSSSGSIIDINGGSNGKLSGPRSNCTALNDKITGKQSRAKQSESTKSAARLWSRGKSIEGQVKNVWVPSLKNSLHRSLSLQSGARPSINRKPPPHTGFNDKQGGGKRRQSAAAGKEDSLGKRQFSITGKRLKSVISSRVGKYDSLFGKYSLKAVTSFLGSVFILLANVSLLLDGSASLVEAASLPSAVVQPIWLRDGLISQLVSDDDLLSEPQQEVLQLDRLPGAIEQQQLNEQDQEPVVDFTQVPADGNDPADLRQAILGRTPWFKIEELKSVAPKEKDRDDKEHDGDELLWIERRRLERDRALEPPPWLREQPMRRNIAPTVEQQPGDNKSEPPIEIPIITSDSSSAHTSSVRHNRARQSRQLADQIYESFLKLLAEGSYGSSSFLDDLYAELELRNKANQRQQKSQTTINSGANPLYGNSAIQLKQQQSQNKQQDQQQEQQQLQSVSQMQSGGGQVQMDSQMQEPDSTLVVVGDEVSGGDDEATAMDGADASSTRQMSAAYTMQNDMNTSRDGPAGAQAATYLADPSGAGLAEMAQPKQAPLDAIAYGEVGSFVARPEGNGGAGGRLISSADLGMSSDQMQQQQPPASSFHVVEDIDQMDSSQDTGSNEHPSAQDTETSDMSPQEQQQQREQETANWSLQTEVNSQPFKSYHMKRSVAKFRMPGQQNFNELPDREFHTGKLYRPQDQLALTLIGSAKLSRGQLIGAAAKLKMYLEDMIGLPRATILGLYPMNSNQLLVKLDTSKLDPRYVANTLSKYDYARGFIVVTWPSSSQQNPMSLLSAISQALAQDEIEPVSTNVDASRGEYSILDAQAFKAPSPLSNLVNPYMLARPSSVETGAQFRPNNLELEAAELDDEDDETMAYPLMRSISGSKLGYLMQPSANSAPDRLSLAALARYLSAIYAAEQVGNPGYGISEQVDPSIVLAPKEAHRNDPIDNKGLYQPYMLHFLVLMVAILGAYLAVKLVMSSHGKRALRRRFGRNGSMRSLWSSSRYSADDDEEDHDAVDEVLNHQQTQGKQGADLQASNPRQLTKRHLSDDSGHVSAQEIGAKEQKTHPAGLDVLAQRLINLLSYHHYYQRHKNKPDIEDGECKKGSCEKESAGLAVDKKEELDEVSANDFEINTCSETATIGSNPGPQPYRSSHSYIKSLIDVLSKARAQFPSSQQHRHRSKTPLIADDTMDLSPGGELDSNCGGEVSLKLQQQQQQLEEEDAVAAGVLMSQMDISAAHLILAYMEKHLEDKERLRREWLELNGCSGGSNSSSGNKIVQLTLQKLAKVALSEANIGKNRNRSVVPFDRNRVRLASCSDAAATATSASQDQSGANNKPAGGGGGGGSGGLKLQQQQQTGDYINASYIYDDDLRRPTHIIAQGPTEQTSHQFWQMVWEQGISVIVMLTRLNENSKQMCHCYWPKNNSFEASATATGGAGQPAGSPSLAQVPSGPSGALGSGETTAAQRAALWKDESTSAAPAALAANGASSPTTPANGRRVSVTSVFNTLAALQNGNGQPIIANGDLNNNMISFNVDYTSTSNDNDEHTDNDKENVSDDEQQTSIGGKSTGAVPIGNKSKNSTTKAAAPQATATARFEVHLVSEHVSSSDYLVRNMYMINRSTGETRTITQFHYLAWPEAGVPDNVKSFLAFRRKVHKSYRNLKSPILVHCSDGGGRSGTYTLIDIILERIKKGAKEIDPRATLEHLRDQRVGLCGTQSQFEFVSVALAEEIQIILNALPQ